MKLDDEVCLCFHVTRRKVVQFVRVNRPEVASQLSECFGAGTGCGWCRPYLERIFVQQQNNIDQRSAESPSAVDARPAVIDDLPEAADYARSRSVYRASLRTRPPEP